MTRSHAVKLSATLFAGIAVSACASATLAPRHERPAAPAQASLPYAENEPGAKAMLLSWRDVFIDPELRCLIETALANNRDLRVATLNVERARALYRVQRSESFPEIDATQNYFRQRTGENAATGVVGAPGPSGGRPITTVQNSVNANVSAYELDLFGRVRSLNRQALETYFAEEETRKAAEISLVAEVANAYLQLAADRELLAIARDTYESQQASLDLTRELVENGVGNDLDVERAHLGRSGARNRARLSASKTDRKIARARYEQSIENAFRDVADALATRRTIGEQIEATENLADAASKSYGLAQARFRNGVDNYLSVLDARAANLIGLYRALGGDLGGRDGGA